MSNLELKKGKSIRYEDYQIDVFDNEGKINLVIKRGGLSFVFNSKMEYSEKFNYVAESNSEYETLTISFYDKREKTPLFRLPTDFVKKFVDSIEVPVIEGINIECFVIFGSVAGFVAEKIIIKDKKNNKEKETYTENFLSDLNQTQRMYNFSSFSSGTARPDFKMEEDFLSHLISNLNKEIEEQTNQFISRTDYFQI